LGKANRLPQKTPLQKAKLQRTKSQSEQRPLLDPSKLPDTKQLLRDSD
jgi:hypothetical protein